MEEFESLVCVNGPLSSSTLQDPKLRALATKNFTEIITAKNKGLYKGQIAPEAILSIGRSFIQRLVGPSSTEISSYVQFRVRLSSGAEVKIKLDHASPTCVNEQAAVRAQRVSSRHDMRGSFPCMQPFTFYLTHLCGLFHSSFVMHRSIRRLCSDSEYIK